VRRRVRDIAGLKLPRTVRVNLVAMQQNRSLESSDDMGVHVKESAVQSKKSGVKPVQRVIKKYPNRRLYDTETSTSITLTEVKQLVIQNAQFVVRDAKTGDDLTRSILLQIILEEESGGMPLFSADLLSQLIRSDGNAMQGTMGSYLERNIRAFQDIQKALQEQSQRMYGDGGRASQELWAQFMNLQGPAMQSLMQAYIEQSQKMFQQFQDQMQNQARNMFTGLSFPGFPAGQKSDKGEGDK
jgi:polyhydroxyalkanoate synthesis repressor PhaR